MYAQIVGCTLDLMEVALSRCAFETNERPGRFVSAQIIVMPAGQKIN